MGKAIFWEDAAQAQERLGGSYCLHGDTVVYVSRIGEDEEPYADCTVLPLGERKRIPLSDPLFHRFRKLPPVGWVNCQKAKEAVYLNRRPIRARQHGLSDANVSVGNLNKSYAVQYRDWRYETIAADTGYSEACRGDYPGMEEVLTHIREESTVAISSLYAVMRDTTGLRWLYRNDQRVGLFHGQDSLLLTNKHAYLREEIMESSSITVKEIKEF